MLRISRKKGLRPRFPVIGGAMVFNNIMGPILAHMRANNKLEIKMLRSCAHYTNNAVFEYVRKSIPIPELPAPKEKLLTYNDTISWLRTQYVKMNRKIDGSSFGYNP